MYKAYITALTNVRPHSNADRLQLADVFGNTVCVSLDYYEGQVGLYLPSDGQISVEFGEKNNLLRKKDDAGNNIGGYIDPVKRNIAAIRLRGEKSDGIFLPLSCLNYCYAHGDASIELRVGDVIDGVVNGHDICQKYIPRTNHRQCHVSEGNRTRKKRVATAPLFAEHADTEQLAYNLGAFKAGDEIEISLKMHGTSTRTAYLPVFKGYKRTFWDWLLRREGTPIYEYGYVSGTRRTVLENWEGGYYGDNAFREPHCKVFEGKLHRGEAVYAEIVGFTTNGTPIMGSCDNKKLNDKEFIKQYGPTTTFSYGCSPDGKKTMWGKDEDGNYSVRIDVPQSDLYVYRMTMTNEDGYVVEYPPHLVRYRCEQMGVKCVPLLWKGTIPENEEVMYVDKDGDDVVDTDEVAFVKKADPGEWILAKANEYIDGADPIGKTHLREGVVVRIVNRPKFAAYKQKSFEFRVLEGIIKDTAASPDLEEAQEILDAE